MKEILERLYWRSRELRMFQPGGVSGRVVAAVVAAGALLIAVAVWASLRAPKSHEVARMPDGIPWICDNGHVFTLSGKDLTEHLETHTPVLCPTCGAVSHPATKCPNCGNMVAAGPPPDHLCPIC